ncbi:MAG: hypothetical protein EXS58_14590 [Candidatus Latescibacteria bacterium]|nr:hypothetical protein [Candidatus Latescibacterota bacterium]
MNTARITRALFLLGASCLLTQLVGCGEPSSETPILAEVGDQRIEVAEFEAFSAAIPEGMKEGATPEEADRQLLEALIDKKLLLLEAQALKIEDDPSFKRKLDEYERDHLFELYREQVVNLRIDITEEEREAHWRKTHRDRALRFAGIMVETQEAALQVLAELKAGADFQRLAAKRSLHRETGKHGGDSGVYMLKDKVEKGIADHLYHLDVGAVSDPVPMGYEGKSRYVVFKILDAIPAPLSASREEIDKELVAQKMAERRMTVLDSLTQVYRPHIYHDKIALITSLAPVYADEDFVPPGEQGGEMICSYEGGQVSIAEFCRIVQAAHVPPRSLADSTQIVSLLERAVIPQRLVLAAARAAGVDRDPRMLRALATKRVDLLLSVLRWRQVDRNVTVTEGEARAFYDTNPEKFIMPGTTVVIEILVPADSLAQRLKRELQDTKDPERLALQYTQRKGSKQRKARLQFDSYTRQLHPQLYDAVQTLGVGQVGGPVKVEEGYSVFKVEERKQELTPYDADSQRRARAYVKIDRAKRGYVDYVRALRQKYPVVIREENWPRRHESARVEAKE